MKSKRVIERLQDELRHRFKIAGPGSVARVEGGLDLSPGYFRDQRRPDRLRLDLKVFFQALDILAIDTAEFFSTVLGPVDPMKAFIKEGKALRIREKRLPSVFQLIVQRDKDTAQDTSDLEALDAQTESDPIRTKREVSTVLAKLPEEQVAEALGIYGSASLALGQIDQAQMILGTALELSTELEDTRVQAELLLRCSEVVSAQSRFDQALRLAEIATLRFISASDLPGIGKSLLHQGVHQRSMQERQKEITAFDKALFYLPADSDDPAVLRLRATAMRRLASSFSAIGDLDSALTFAQKATEYQGIMERTALGKLLRLQGHLALRQGNLTAAEEYLRKAFEILHCIPPLDAIRLTVDRIRVFLLANQIEEARQAALTMGKILQSLEGPPAAIAAVSELLKSTRSGREFSPALLDRVSSQIEAG